MMELEALNLAEEFADDRIRKARSDLV